jgi:hypothetical protein
VEAAPALAPVAPAPVLAAAGNPTDWISVLINNRCQVSIPN